MLGPASLYALKYRVRRWVKKAGKAIEARSADIVRKFLMEIRASNKLLTIVKVFTRKVVMCQRFVRAFLHGQRIRKVHMHNLWDEVTKDVIGASEKNAWMYRVLEKSNAKSERCSKELRNMRAVFMHELRFHKNSVKAFQSKLEAFELVKDMGMDEKFIKERLGISLVPRCASTPQSWPCASLQQWLHGDQPGSEVHCRHPCMCTIRISALASRVVLFIAIFADGFILQVHAGVGLVFCAKLIESAACRQKRVPSLCCFQSDAFACAR